MVRIDNHEEFFSQLTLLFDTARTTKSHIDFCIKRYDGRIKPHPRPSKQISTPVAKESLALIRVKVKKKKLSVVIRKDEMIKFKEIYSKSMRINMTGLVRQKRERKPRRKPVQSVAESAANSISTTTITTKSSPSSSAKS